MTYPLMPQLYNAHRSFSSILFFAAFLIALSGCTAKPSVPYQSTTVQTPEQRIVQMDQVNHWKITGKIAFIDKESRNSASLSWSVNEQNNSQQLNLTTYMGINVLSLKSFDNLHTIEVDGKTYKGTNLEQLIRDITGFTLPTTALTYWLKGLPFHAEDEIIYKEDTQLPLSLSSHYNNERWEVIYVKYQSFNNFLLATKFTIKKGDFMIKIAISRWNITKSS